jgi:hypothetical protein
MAGCPGLLPKTLEEFLYGPGDHPRVGWATFDEVALPGVCGTVREDGKTLLDADVPREARIVHDHVEGRSMLAQMV